MSDQRLNEIEDKLDCCLLLLGVLVTADNFEYNLLDKSDNWIRATTIAEKKAFAVSAHVASSHQECKEAELACLIARHGTH